MGETTANIAAAHPENDYLGIEVHTPGVGSLLKEIATRELSQPARDPARRRRGGARHDRAGFAGRHPRLLPRSVAEEAPPQAPPDPAALRCPAGRRGSRPAATCIAPPTGRSTRSRCSRCWVPSRCWRILRTGLRRARPGGRRPSSRRAACASVMASGTCCSGVAETAPISRLRKRRPCAVGRSRSSVDLQQPFAAVPPAPTFRWRPAATRCARRTVRAARRRSAAAHSS